MINIIANVKSGKGRGLKSLKKVTAYCVKNAIEYALHVTNYIGHATELTKNVTKNGGVVIAMGGDGTFHEVLNGIVDIENTTVGFIPAGRGNDFARSMNFSLNPVKALKAILAGKTKKIDYIQVGEKRCLNVCGTGLDVKVLNEVDDSKGGLTYVKSLWYCLNHFTPCHAHVVTDTGEDKKFECIMVGVCNGIAFGGNIRLSPLSKVDDGFLDVIIMQMPANGKILGVLPKFIKGKHMNLPITTHYRCKSVEVESDSPIELDGEIYDFPLNCKIVESGLKVFVE